MTETLLDHASVATKPLSFLWLELTGRCNLECVHCYRDSSPHLPLREGMSDDDWRRAIRAAADAGCDAVQFIGGEPTVHLGLDSFLQTAHSAGHRHIEVFTNGTRLSTGLISRLQQCHGRLAMSFDSDDARVHERITQSPGSFTKTVAGIRKAVEAGIPIVWAS